MTHKLKNKVINHGGVSGGKDSTALLLWMVYESGYPEESLSITFCDTGNEAPETYAYVAMLSAKVHPIVTILPELDFYALAKKKGRFPSSQARFCTQELKMKPTKAHLDALMDEGYTVLNHSGVRAGESADRALLEPREPAWLSFFGCEGYRPLLSWTLADVWAIHERYGIPRNPLYDMGCKRVGCLPCIMSRKAEVLNIALRMPERLDMIRAKEAEIGGTRAYGISTFFARNMVPVRWRDREISVPAKTRTIAATPLGEDALPFLASEFPLSVEVQTGGVRMAVATIDGVERWARAGIGETEALEFEGMEEPPTCDSRSGLCE